jgi:hypothetical protein
MATLDQLTTAQNSTCLSSKFFGKSYDQSYDWTPIKRKGIHMWSVTGLPSFEGAYHGIRAIGKIRVVKEITL